MIKRVLPLVALFILIPFWAEGKELYVNNSGSPACSDATTYADNSASNPWCTIGRAAWGSTNRFAPNPGQAAKAGDTVYVNTGTYTGVGTNHRYQAVYNPVNSGTEANPIVFQAVGRVVLEHSGTGPAIGATDVNYITWRGFTIYEINALGRSDTGPVVLIGTTGSRIENCVIDGFDNGAMGDNHNGIRLEWATNVVVRNNRIYNVLNYGTVHMNGAGIMAYYSNGAIIENNEIFNCGSGIFIKGGDNANFTVRYNHVYSNGYGILIQYTSSSGEHRIYQNIVRNNGFGIAVRLRAHNVRVVNNTLVNNGNGILLQNWQEPISNVLLQNNIVNQGSSELVCGGEFTALNQLTIDRNNYNSIQRWSINGVAYSSIATWRTPLGGCPGVGNDCNSTTSNPLFVNASNHDYRLQVDSPVRTLGVDILNLSGRGPSAIIPAGAYITGNEVIGRTSSGGPSTPSGLTIR